MNKTLLAAALALAANTALAGNFNYTYIEGGYGEVDTGDDGDDGDALFIGGSVDLQKGFGSLRATGQEDDREVHLALNSGIPLADPTGGFFFVFQAENHWKGDYPKNKRNQKHYLQTLENKKIKIVKLINNYTSYKCSSN